MIRILIFGHHAELSKTFNRIYQLSVYNTPIVMAMSWPWAMIYAPLVKVRDPPSMPSLCAGMPLITIQYAPNIKRRNTLKSLTHRAYGAVCPVCLHSYTSTGGKTCMIWSDGKNTSTPRETHGRGQKPVDGCASAAGWFC
jgi:hypothetical protein